MKQQPEVSKARKARKPRGIAFQPGDHVRPAYGACNGVSGVFVEFTEGVGGMTLAVVTEDGTGQRREAAPNTLRKG